MNTEQVDGVNVHLRGTVFATEVAGIDISKHEYLVIASDENGKLEFDIHKDDDSISQSDLITKWNAHKIGCSDCAGWSL